MYNVPIISHTKILLLTLIHSFKLIQKNKKLTCFLNEKKNNNPKKEKKKKEQKIKLPLIKLQKTNTTQTAILLYYLKTFPLLNLRLNSNYGEVK